MKKLFLLLFSLNCLYASTTLENIEASIKEASKNFELQKQEHNITKLLDISKILYENNAKIKELKNTLLPKVTLKIEPNEKLDRLQVGDILHVKAQTLHKTNENYEKSLLYFLIYDKEKLLAKKEIEIYEKSGLHDEELKFEVSKPSDDYKICAKFLEDKEYEKCQNISVKELVQIESGLIVTTNVDAQKSDAKLTANKDLYLFLLLKNQSGKELNGKITLKDIRTNETVLSENFTKPSIDEVKKAGVFIPKSFVTPDREFYASISLWADGVNKIEKELRFHINDLHVKLDFPTHVSSKKPGKFFINPGNEFAKPLKIDLNPYGGIVIGSKDNLKGTLSAITNKQENAYIDVSILGANGLKWKKRVFVRLGDKQGVQEDKRQEQTPIIAKQDKKAEVGDTRIQGCGWFGSGDYHGDCTYRYDGKFWKAEGDFKFYYTYDYKDITQYKEIWIQKNALAIVGKFVHGKPDGKVTYYYPNAKIAQIKYYKYGKAVPNKSIYYFSNGKLWRTVFERDGHIINVQYTRDGRLYSYLENIGNAYIKVRSWRILEASDLNGQLACKAEFNGNKLYKITCYYPTDDKSSKTVVGIKALDSLRGIRTRFNPFRSGECTNRVDYDGKIRECKNHEEDIYIARFSQFASLIGKSKGSKYLNVFDVRIVKAMAGESLYHVVFNSILNKKTYIHSNPTKECKSIEYTVHSKFLKYFKELNNKIYFYEKANELKNFNAIKMMIMKDFAKKYYPRTKKVVSSDIFHTTKCYNEVVNFYKQLGYNNAY
jgi:antitoxin component YwqK of YwqJK toxin-antitoxin module